MAATFEKSLQTTDIPFVVFFADSQIAWRGALTDGSEQAWPEPLPTRIGFFDIQGASSKAKDSLHDLEGSAKLAGAGKRAEKLYSFRAWVAGDLNAGKVLVCCDH